MTKIDFYILKGGATDSLHSLICRLAEKAVLRNQSVFINCENGQTCEVLDAKLWSFKPESFVPHRFIQSGELQSTDEPVLIAHDFEPNGNITILINLCNEVPYFFSRFERILEIINDKDETKISGRQRWNYYKERGYPLKHHSVSL